MLSLDSYRYFFVGLFLISMGGVGCSQRSGSQSNTTEDNTVGDKQPLDSGGNANSDTDGHTDGNADGDTGTGQDADVGINTDTDADTSVVADTDLDTDLDTTVDASVETWDTPPDGYRVVYYRDYETDLSAMAYLGDENWYFAADGSATDPDAPSISDRYLIEDDPIGGDNRALKMIKFDGDPDCFDGGYNPRTELSLRASQEHSAAIEIYWRARIYWAPSQADVFAAEFSQFWLHDNENIPMQLEVRDGHLAARRPGSYRIRFDGVSALSENVGRWMVLESYAKFNRDGGYWRVYKDGELVFTHTDTVSDWPTDNGTWHTQYGAYANNGGDGTMEIFFDDYMLAVKE